MATILAWVLVEMVVRAVRGAVVGGMVLVGVAEGSEVVLCPLEGSDVLACPLEGGDVVRCPLEGGDVELCPLETLGDDMETLGLTSDQLRRQLGGIGQLFGQLAFLLLDGITEHINMDLLHLHAVCWS